MWLNGLGGGIWTHSPRIPNAIRYQIALHPDRELDNRASHSEASNPAYTATASECCSYIHCQGLAFTLAAYNGRIQWPTLYDESG